MGFPGISWVKHAGFMGKTWIKHGDFAPAALAASSASFRALASAAAAAAASAARKSSAASLELGRLVSKMEEHIIHSILTVYVTVLTVYIYNYCIYSNSICKSICNNIYSNSILTLKSNRQSTRMLTWDTR